MEFAAIRTVVNDAVAWKYVLTSPGSEFSGHQECWAHVLDALRG